MTLTAKPIYVPGAACAACHLDGVVASRKYVPAVLEMRKQYKDTECQDCHAAVKGKIEMKG